MEISFLRSLSSVMCISAVIMGVGSIGTSMSLIQMMGGLRYSPEDVVLKRASNVALALSGYGFLFFGSLCVGLAFIKEEYRKDLPAPTERGRMPTAFLFAAGVAWIVALIPQQVKLSVNYDAQVLLQKQDYTGMLDFLSKHKPDDFNKVRRLPPDPYHYSGLLALPEVVKALNGAEAPWVRAMILEYLDIAFQHDRLIHDDTPLLCLENVLKLSDGEAWIKAHSKSIEDHFNRSMQDEPSPELEALAKKLMSVGLNIKLPERKP